jgi:glycosyltransferase involved in cell wall biosynthesis
VLRPLALLRDAGFQVHAVARDQPRKKIEIDGVTTWTEPDNTRVAARILALRAELLFVESITYGAVFGALAQRSWIRNPQPSASARMYRLQRAALRAFDAVSFTNPADPRAWKFSEDKHVDLAYPLDVEFWSTPVARRPGWWTDRGRDAPEGPVIVCNAAYARRKRVCELLEMMAPFLSANRSARFVMVGHQLVEPDVTKWITERPAALGIDQQVLVTGWMSSSELRELLAWAAVSVINSIWETQCLAVYEALAAGVPTLIASIPVLTSQFPTLPAHRSDTELRANLERVLSEPAVGQRMLETTRERVAWADTRRHDEVFAAGLRRVLGTR